MLFAEASEKLQIVQGVLTLIGTIITAFLAYKTVQLQTQATIQRQTLLSVKESVAEVKHVTDGITERLVQKAEEKGVEVGRRIEVEKQTGTSNP